MQSYNSQEDLFDLTVPPLEQYFSSSNDMYTSNPFFGNGHAHGHAHDSIDPSVTLAPASLPAAPSAPVGGVASLSLMSAAPTPSLEVTNSPAKASAPSFSFSGMEKLFYIGTPTSANDSSLYVQIPSSENEGGVSCGSEFWVSVTWDTIVPKLVGYPYVLEEVMKSINSKADLKERALKLLGGVAGVATTTTSTSDGGLVSDRNTDTTSSTSSLSVPPSATFSTFSGRDSQPFSYADTNSTSNQISRASSTLSFQYPRQASNDYLTSPVRSSRTPSFSTQQDTPAMTPNTSFTPWNISSAQYGDLSLKLPAMPTPAPGIDDLIKHHLSRSQPPSTASSADFDSSIFDSCTDFNTGISVFTARTDTIDPFLLAQHDVIHNENTLEYVWSRSDSTLYKADSAQGQQALTESGSVKFIFPPRTMLLSYEKDGTIATPAYSNLHPHSNEWLKAQVCHRSCPYRAGTASLKRPKTVREHFRKCVYLDDKHPLKVLSALQLGVLEREANGQLPNRRRAKVIRLATESANTLY